MSQSAVYVYKQNIPTDGFWQVVDMAAQYSKPLIMSSDLSDPVKKSELVLSVFKNLNRTLGNTYSAF
jgi:hypothetical protein